jgi:hypothetical protein
LKTLKTFENFISEKKDNTASKIKKTASKQKTAVKKVKKFLKKDKGVTNDIKDGKADSADKIKSMIFKLKAKAAQNDVVKIDLKKKELELKSKLDTIKKSKRKEEE